MPNLKIVHGKRIVEPPVQHNVYTLTINFMHGDADGDSDAILKFTADEKGSNELRKTWRVLMACQDVLSPSAGGQPYSDIPDWDTTLGDYWPHDMFYDEIRAALNHFSVIYTDSVGCRYNVTIEEDESAN